MAHHTLWARLDYVCRLAHAVLSTLNWSACSVHTAYVFFRTLVTMLQYKGWRHQYTLYFQPRPWSRCWSTRLYRCRSTVKVKKYPQSTVNLYCQLGFHRTHTLWATSTVSGLVYYREFMPYCNFFVLTRWDWLAKFSSVDSGRGNR